MHGVEWIGMKIRPSRIKADFTVLCFRRPGPRVRGIPCSNSWGRAKRAKDARSRPTDPSSFSAVLYGTFRRRAPAPGVSQEGRRGKAGRREPCRWRFGSASPRSDRGGPQEEPLAGVCAHGDRIAPRTARVADGKWQGPAQRGVREAASVVRECESQSSAEPRKPHETAALETLAGLWRGRARCGLAGWRETASARWPCCFRFSAREWQQDSTVESRQP